MQQKNRIMKIRILISIITLFCATGNSFAQYYQDAKHHKCLQCHSSQMYSFHNDLMDVQEKRLMNPYYILDTIALMNGVHKNFDCTDCHSFEYETYPHASNLKLEPMMTCLDCHGGDESFASYHFDEINEEVQKSIHFQAYGDAFSCSKCHDQHTYTPTARNSDDVLKIVDYSNKMCLSCHNDMKKYALVAGRDNPVLVEVHNWLPNQELHFQHVRCIECHTDVTDTLLVSHNILSKEMAVRKCAECHSANSRLKASLYKYENLHKRSDNGTVSTLLTNKSYVIGTQQSPILKKLSILIFIAVLIGIIIHSTFRFLKK